MGTRGAGASHDVSTVDSAAHDQGDQRVVVFACPHGVGKSRIAAATFEAAAHERGLHGWRAFSAASSEPGTATSDNAVRLVAETVAEPFLETGPGRAWATVLEQFRPDDLVTVVIDDPSRGHSADLSWRLVHQEFDERMRDEITQQVTHLIEHLDSFRGAREMR